MVLKFDEGFRVDVLVEDSVTCELKAVSEFDGVCTAQLLTYVRLAGKRLGFLVNFKVAVIKHETHRIVL